MHSSCIIVILLCYYYVSLCFQVFILIGAPIEKRSENKLKTLKFSILHLWLPLWLAPCPYLHMGATLCSYGGRHGVVAGATRRKFFPPNFKLKGILVFSIILLAYK